MTKSHYPPSLGGMCGAIVTSPFDVVKTRLQSSLFREKHARATVSVLHGGGTASVLVHPPRSPGLLYHFVETAQIIKSVHYYSHVFSDC